MPTQKSGFPRNWTIANIRRSNFCRRPLTILLSNSSRGENRSSRSLGLSPNFPSASERCSNSTLSKVSQKELWPESLACQRGSAHREKGQRAHFANDHGQSGIEGKKRKGLLIKN